jgi:hypothetical protein
MRKLNKYRLLIIILSIIALTGCDLDINTDPNNPTEAELSTLLSSSQANMAYVFGNDPGGLNSHAGTVMHHYVQRGLINDYGLLGGDFEIVVSWGSLYAGALTDLRVIIDAATENEDYHYAGVAKIMQAFIFASIVDVWGDVPYFEANLGTENAFPRYDDGSEIYADLQIKLDEAIADLARDSNLSPRSDDLLYGGDLTKWRKMAKTLKLKMYNNVRLVQDVSSEVSALINEGDLIGNGDDFEFQYGTSISPENRNPGYVQEWSQGGAFFNISPYFFEVMRSQNTFNHGGLQFGIEDPRIPYYFYNQLPEGSSDEDAENPCAYCPSDAGTSFLSIYAFSFNIDPNEGFDQGRSRTVAGLYALGGAYDAGEGGEVSNAAAITEGQVSGVGTTPQRLMTYHERLFIEAELAQIGLTGGDARQSLSDAIDAAFAKVNFFAGEASAPSIPDTDRDDYRDAVLALYDGASTEEQLEIIMTQKWISSFGNALVSYADYRRTGFPRLHDGNTDNLSVTVRTRDFPVSFPYDINNLALNPNAPSQRVIARDKVFWDN